MKSKKINIEIEYLRAIAILIVMLSHLPFLVPFYRKPLAFIYFNLYATWTGVDLFFCISGFIIAKSYANYFDEHRRNGNFWLGFKAFWIKRAYRLLPSSWFWALAGLVLCCTFNETGAFSTIRQNIVSIAAIVTFTGNLANQCGLYLIPNSVYWSLALEEQFYFVFPLFLYLVVNRKTRFWTLGLLVLVQFFINRNPFGTPVQAMFAAFRVDAIILGILLYYFSNTAAYKALEPISLRGSKIKTLILTLLLVYLLGAIPGQLIKMPIALGLVAVISAILVLLSSYQQHYIFSAPVVSPIMAWIGARSYGLYLIHVPAYRITFEIWTRYLKSNGEQVGPQYGPWMLLSGLVLMFILADLNYRFLETPLRRLGAKISSRVLEQAEPSVQTNGERGLVN